MTSEELQEIIEKLNASNDTQDASFRIRQFGGGPDESFISANKQGLELFAARLLEASRMAGKDVPAEEKYVPLEQEEWISGDTIVHYVEPAISKDRIVASDYEPSWKDRAVSIGCFVSLIIMLVMMIIGIVQVIKWIIE